MIPYISKNVADTAQFFLYSFNMKHFIPLFGLFALSFATEGYQSPIIGVEGPRWQGPFADHVLGQPVGDTPEVAAAKAAHYKAHARILEILPVLPQEKTTETVDVVTQPPTYSRTFVPQPVPVVYQQPYVPQPSPYVVRNAIPASVQSPVVSVQPNQQYVQYAEEIPRSELGELPEVAAARKAHLAAFEEIKKRLPQLVENSALVPGVQQPQLKQQVVPQQVQVVSNVPQSVLQQSQESNVNHQADIAAYKQQLQRNLEWFYNPQQFYEYLPQDTPEVAAAKVEHLKLLQAAI